MFNISQNGFIPDYCLEKSPREVKYLDDILQKYQKGDYGNTLDTFRQDIKNVKLNVDECMILIDGYSDAEIQKLYSVTSFLAHLYVWGGKIPQKNIPEGISIPWYLSSDTLGIACVLTHAALDMYNWRLLDKDKPFSIDNIEPQNYFNIDPEVRESEKWFYLPMIAIEGECGSIIHLMEEIYGFLENETADDNQHIILKNLELIEEKMKRQYEILRMTLNCNPDHFYYLIRPFLWGSKQKDSSGWYLEGIEMYVEYSGGSAAQSSLIPAEDAFLGIKHPRDKFLLCMRDYIPADHRHYLEHQETRPGFQQLRIELGDEDYLPIEKVRQRCVMWLKKFRDFHKVLVQKYVVAFNDSTGTGGTDINKNLNQYINNTEVARSELEDDYYREFISCADFISVIIILIYCLIVTWFVWNCNVDDIHLELLN